MILGTEPPCDAAGIRTEWWTVTESAPDHCAFCDGTLPPEPVSTAPDTLFCSTGCRAVFETIGRSSHTTIDAASQRAAQASTAQPDHATTYFRIDGMHTALCESYLERVAKHNSGVAGAEASYITETIRVEYAPSQISPDAIRDSLSHLGYTAYHRDHTSEARSNSMTTRAQEVSGIRKRRSDHMLGARYIVGIVFGTFLLIPYVVMLYPVYLASLFDGGMFSVFVNTISFENGDGLQVLRVFVVFTVIVLFFTGMPVLRGAYVSLKMRAATTDLLVTITILSAFVASIFAVLAGRTTLYFDVTVLIAAGVTAAIFYESSTKQRAMDRLTDLTNSQVDTARLLTETGTTEVPVDELAAGDRVLVPQGARIPVDGVMDEGECLVDEAIITGESLPVRKRSGDSVFGGSIVVTDAATVRIDAATTSRIEQLTTTVWNLQSADHGVQRHANALAGKAIPIVISLAVLAGLWMRVTGATNIEAILWGAIVLLVASPWALGLATPLSVASSIAEAVDRGIVVFDETIFERLRDIDVVVFDKTGTLTTGEMEVIESDVPPDLLRAVVELERRSSHPAATAIVTAFDADEHSEIRADGGDLESHPTDDSGPRVREFQSHATGVEGTVDGQHVLVGNLQLFRDHNWSVSDPIATRVDEARGFGRLPIIVGSAGAARGIIVVGDEPRTDWETVITRIAERDIEVIVLTGDDADATTYFRDHPAVTHVFPEIQPSGKTATIRRLQTEYDVTMVGDGTNDAPALAEAELGIALGSGTALAADAADLAILTDDLMSVETAFDLADAAGRRVRQNNRLALVYNAIAVPSVIAGMLNPLFIVGATVVTMGVIAANCARDLIQPT